MTTISVFFNDREIINNSTQQLNQVQFTPMIYINNPEPNALYTILLTDPDAPYPDNPVYADFLHWMIINVTGTIPSTEHGMNIVTFIPSTPFRGNFHRYIFTLYKQTQRRVNIPFIYTQRRNFNTQQFITMNNLVHIDSVMYRTRTN